ncbi:uncharacterized protein PG998_003103 [Apiospora kogelbergensis]|uniref:E3 ubiquitin-protein ligase listerin n=1 Tax=Apiospora kogelbergensis TaxID=1337665 RepID=A0AAW0QKI0_9PEZI
MSRRTAKAQAASGKAAFATGGGFGGFGAFSSASSGSNLSYLSEPPNFSTISDANAAVSFKNLLKKDATTKSKALEELVSFVEAHPYERDGGVEEAVLDVWVQMYPRISIDNSRRVRELSHTLQLELVRSARKRMERRIPKIVGTWLAGTFDRDRGVARVATDGLASFLTTPEKVLQFWRKCQTQILEYASDAIIETIDTLSDERSTNADDAEAKYYRVLGGSLALVLNLLEKLETAEIEKNQENYETFFQSEKIWTSAVVNENFVRRQSHQMVRTCLDKMPALVEAKLPQLSKIYIAEGLKSDQTGSGADFIATLLALTAKHPTIWTTDYKAKKSPLSRLQLFLEKGSQGGSASHWESVDKLINTLPEGILPTDLEGATKCIESLRAGVVRREEPRSNAVAAWSCYLSLVRYFILKLDTEGAAIKLAQDCLFPLTEQYLFPRPELSAWASGCQIPVVIKAYTSSAVSPKVEVVRATELLWETLRDQFRERMKGSLPEASKDHEKSQKAIAEEGERWFALTGKILEGHSKTIKTDRPIPDIPAKPSAELLMDALKLLETRQWKPFGAAATIQSSFKSASLLFASPHADEFLRQLEDAVSTGGLTLLKSSSAPYLFSSIVDLGEVQGRQAEFTRIWKAMISSVLSADDNKLAVQAVTMLISSNASASSAHQDKNLQTQLVQFCLECTSGSGDVDWKLYDGVLGYNALTDESTMTLVKELVQRLAKLDGQPSSGVCKGLLLIAQNDPQLLSTDDEIHMSLMTSILSLSEQSSDPDLISLKALLDKPSTKPNKIEIIQHNLNDASLSSLTIETLVQQAMHLGDAAGDAQVLESIMPDVERWKQELASLSEGTPNSSLSLTSSLAGSYFLVAPATSEGASEIKRDRGGCSIAGRMAIYLTKMLSSGLDLGPLSSDKQADLLVCLGITAELASDQLTVMGRNKVWASLKSDATQKYAEDLISSSRKLLSSSTDDASGWRDGSGSRNSEIIHTILSKLLEATKSTTTLGLYHARVLSELVQALTERHGFPSSAEDWLNQLQVLKSSPTTILPAAAILSGAGETLSASKTVNNFCNRLVSDVAGATLQSDKTLGLLVVLNACMPVYEVGELPVANNRLVFAAKQITSWLESPEELDYRLATESCRALRYLLPCIKDVYGSYWERAVDFCLYLFTKKTGDSLDCQLPCINAALRLLTTIQGLEDPNDDLVDVLQSTAEARSTAIVELLNLSNEHEQDTQPLEIVATMVCRLVEKIPLDHVKDLSDLYGLVAADSRTIQTAAFSVLHKALPAAQEQLSLDVLLDKKTAKLPDELLSLLLEAPTLDAYSDEALARFPTPIRSYLLSWHLVFDAFQAASFKLRSDYADILKSENYIGPLMEFTFDVLGHSAAHGLNLDKENLTADHITSYDIKLAETELEEKNMQWLLVHLFYLVLKYVPGLFKAWYIDCRSKQTKIAVESWVAKYFSPIIVSETLDDVTKWAESQEAPADDEKELIVRVSRAAKEITVGYEVDEHEASIAIRVPPAFPLDGVAVGTVNRLAVSEKKWQAWILATQGVITFSGGSIVDGLLAFKRNVNGAMKGQTECAICYSIISSDKRIPDKACSTCKNLFHRSCLYKWFRSSNQNTCPLCRNPIDYLS